MNDQDQSRLINSKKTEELIAYLLCNAGEFVAKRKIAEQLWENFPEERAMDNFYKTYKRLNALPALGVPLCVEALRGKIRLDLCTVESDLQTFERLYKRNDVASWEQALNPYRGPLLRDEYYNWTTLPESHYDLCRTELFERIFAHYKESKNNEKLSIYRRKWEDEL